MEKSQIQHPFFPANIQIKNTDKETKSIPVWNAFMYIFDKKKRLIPTGNRSIRVA